MLRVGSMLATTALLLSADVSGVIRLRPAANERVEFPPSENLPVLPKMSPDFSAAGDQDQAAQQSALTSNLERARMSPCSQSRVWRWCGSYLENSCAWSSRFPRGRRVST